MKRIREGEKATIAKEYERQCPLPTHTNQASWGLDPQNLVGKQYPRPSLQLQNESVRGRENSEEVSHWAYAGLLLELSSIHREGLQPGFISSSLRVSTVHTRPLPGLSCLCQVALTQGSGAERHRLGRTSRMPACMRAAFSHIGRAACW